MADHKKTKGRKKQQRKRRPRPFIENPDAHSIEEFCQRHGISVTFFYKVPEQMPKTFRIGMRPLISREAAAAWRAQRTAASEAAE